MPTQTTYGKAFEYACLLALHNKYQSSQTVVIEQSAQLKTASQKYDSLPDDEKVVIGTNQGEPVVGIDSKAGQAYMNICKRILGIEVPFLDLDAGNGLFSKLSHIFKKD